MQNMLGAFPNMVDGYGIYQKGKQAQGNRLAALAFNAQGADRESALGKLAGIDPNQAYRLKTDFDEQDKIGLSEGSRYLLAAPDAVKPQVYASLVQRYGHKFRAQGIEPPQDYREAMPFFEQLAQSAGGGLRVHSQYMGDDGNVRVVMNDGSEKALGKYSPKYTPHFDAYGNVTGFNPRTNELTPTTVGGNQPSAEVQLTAPDGESIDYNSMSPDDQAAYNLILQNPGVGQTVRVQNGQVISSTMGGQQARVGVKPDAPKEPKTAIAYDADGNAFVADVSKPGAIPGAVRPGSQLSAKDKAKLEATKRKEYAMINSNAAKINETVRIIDSLLGSDALGGVTGIGAVGSKIPGTKWADAGAKLETLRAKSAFGALSEMRANSPTGGALGSVTERELSLLQNAETQLSQAQSPEAFAQALREYKRILLESQKRMVDGVKGFYDNNPQQPAAPANDDDALINKYLSK